MLAGSDQEPAMNAFYEHHKDSDWRTPPVGLFLHRILELFGGAAQHIRFTAGGKRIRTPGPTCGCGSL
jgi:hypothetical protein